MNTFKKIFTSSKTIQIPSQTQKFPESIQIRQMIWLKSIQLFNLVVLKEGIV